MVNHKYNDVIREELEETDITAMKITIKINGEIISKEYGNLYIKVTVLI
jgi:hypothetical protein